MYFEDQFGDTLNVLVTDSLVTLEADELGNSITLEFPRSEFLQILVDLASELGAKVTDKAPAAQDPVTVLSGASGDPEQEWNRVACQAAGELGLGIEFRYATADDAPIQPRSLTAVHGVLTSANGNLLVHGIDHDRDDDTRSFRLDRIKGFVTVKAK